MHQCALKPLKTNEARGNRADLHVPTSPARNQALLADEGECDANDATYCISKIVTVDVIINCTK